ncbi:MAG: Na+ dependent nucleoside transporter N-terminal domain-containing protein, partial [bacterium]|nr:Na+ dependent nucleoside transporter N-terminal domain-containing protein [bacterium]
MERFTGIIGIAVIIGICYLMSNNRKKINLKTVSVGFLLQFLLAVFVLKVPLGQQILSVISKFI